MKKHGLCRLLILSYISVLIAGCSAVEPAVFDFKTLERPDKPNNYLVCPPNFCRAKTNEIAPVFNVNATTLANTFDQIILAQPRTSLIKSEPHKQLYQYVQRSLVFRFPDIIHIQYIPVNHDHATLAIYSNAVYGYYDFKVNEKRIKHWLQLLEKALMHDIKHQRAKEAEMNY